MSRRKISVIVLSTLLFGNSLNCLSANQKRTVQRGRVVGHLVTPNVTITTNNPGEIPIVSDTENNDTITDNVPNEEPDTVVDENEKAARNVRIKEIKNKYKKFLNDAQLNCMDIADKLKVIQGLATGTTVISTAGTLATGGALVSEIVDKEDKNQGLETGLLVGGALASTGGVVTSAVALADMDKLINKMKDCRDNINNIKMVRSELVEEDVEDTDDTLKAVNDIVSNCGGIDNNSVKNVESIKKILVGSTVTSSVGAATSVVAAVTNNIKAKDATEENKLNLATQISTGISTGAQGATLILSATTISKVNKDKDTADDCENTLMKY